MGIGGHVYDDGLECICSGKPSCSIVVTHITLGSDISTLVKQQLDHLQGALPGSIVQRCPSILHPAVPMCVCVCVMSDMCGGGEYDQVGLHELLVCPVYMHRPMS